MLYQRSLFRKESLSRLSSPEKLDQLMKVVSPKSWLSLVALGCSVTVGIIWSIYGSIPVTLEGQGVLIYPRKVVPLQSTNSGQVLAVNVKAGDKIKKGQILATIDQSELLKQLQQQRAKLTELKLQEQAANSLQGIRTQQETITNQQQRYYLQQRIQEIQATTPLVKTKNNDSINQQRQSLLQRIKETQALTPNLQERMEIRRKLFEEEKAVTSDVALEAKQQYLENLQKISQFQTELKELDVKEAEQEKTYRENMNAIAELQAQLKRLDSEQASLAEQHLESATIRKKEIQETQREIARLELQLRNNTHIISQHSGRVLELTIAPGMIINQGVRLGNIDQENPVSKLVGVSYFPVAEGKKIQPGMKLQITPQTVKRERFGGIQGTVTAVSPFPISKEEATNLVGSSELVEGLVSQRNGVIQVFSQLEIDSTTPSGYKWSSSTGPQLKISPGTTTAVRVKVEELAPISYVLPILRSASGTY
jgi:HlyD family secretion protein